MSSDYNKRKSLIWQISRDEFISKIEESVSLVNLLNLLGFDKSGATYQTIYKRIDEEGLDLNLIKKRWKSNKLYLLNLTKEAIDIQKVLTVNSTYSRHFLKKRLIRENLLENKCSECGQLPEWNGKPLSLQLDHINGVNNDNRLENLRLLCPNCHSQTHTFGSKNIKKEKVISPRPRKVDWPSKEELEDYLLRKIAFTTIGKIYGVSDNAVRKWCKHYKIGKYGE